MLKFQFKKLVRDKIIDQQIASGAKPNYRTLTQADLRRELVKKIQEEAGEITSAKIEDVASEIADVQQAIDDLRASYSLSKEDIAKKQRYKNTKNGSFTKGIYIEYVEVQDDDKWIGYYKENADRYPQIA